MTLLPGKLLLALHEDNLLENEKLEKSSSSTSTFYEVQQNEV